MKKLRIADFYRDCSGATAVEYGLIAALISIVIFAALLTIGPRLSNIFTNASNGMH